MKSHANDNNNEQYSRRSNVRIYGIPEKKVEDYYDAVVNFCRNSLKCEIDQTHRVRKQRNDPTPRAMIVTFLSYQRQLRLNILKHR